MKREKMEKEKLERKRRRNLIDEMEDEKFVLTFSTGCSPFQVIIDDICLTIYHLIGLAVNGTLPIC